MKTAHVVIVTGLSGSGKSTAIRALEDLGFYCIDNLPIVLMDKFLTLAEHHDEIRRVALGIDARERRFLDRFQEAVARVRADGHRVDVLFLDCDDEVLIRRYSETRRRHPLEGESGSLAAGIVAERKLLAGVRDAATWPIDTSVLNLHQLKAMVQQAYEAAGTRRMGVSLVSFGFKHGAPREADWQIDCRLLPNPYFVEGLRPKTGVDPEVRAFLEGRDEWRPFLDHLWGLLRFALPLHEVEGKPMLTVALGCTGGQHRSVAVCEALAERLRADGVPVRVTHRELAVRNDETGKES